MRRLRSWIAFAAAAGAAVVALGGCVVVPSVEFTHSQFEGFDVISYVPEDPTGIVYIFHGSNGSANFAEKIETVDVLNTLIERGYGFVATESTERTGTRRWNVNNPSLTTNPDLARLIRLQQHLVDTTPVAPATPIFGLGMSNGARFVSLFGQTWSDAGYPVGAIAMYMGRVAAPVEAAGPLTVPTLFITAEHDFTSPPGPIIVDYGQTQAAGTPTQLLVGQEQDLSSLRFLRIPDIDGDEANAIVAALVAEGIWNSAGQRVVSIDDAVSRLGTVSFPASTAAQRAAIIDQCAFVLAVHQMRADFKVQTADFFDQPG
jgi:poly(3-hydroxybutyrate) depolymerase